MNLNDSAVIRPLVHPQRVGVGHVDAAVAHRPAEVVVPVRAMQRVALIEVLHPLHAGQIVARAAHRLRVVAHVDAELARDRRRVGQAGRDDESAHGRAAFIGRHALRAEVDVNPALGRVAARRRNGGGRRWHVRRRRRRNRRMCGRGQWRVGRRRRWCIGWGGRIGRRWSRRLGWRRRGRRRGRLRRRSRSGRGDPSNQRRDGRADSIRANGVDQRDAPGHDHAGNERSGDRPLPPRYTAPGSFRRGGLRPVGPRRGQCLVCLTPGKRRRGLGITARLRFQAFARPANAGVGARIAGIDFERARQIMQAGFAVWRDRGQPQHRFTAFGIERQGLLEGAARVVPLAGASIGHPATEQVGHDRMQVRERIGHGLLLMADG